MFVYYLVTVGMASTFNNFQDWLSLIGGISCNLIAFIYPALIYMKLKSLKKRQDMNRGVYNVHEKDHWKPVAIVIVFVGIFDMVLSLISDVYTIVHG